jgi:PAS domain S-box-containing protein
VRRPENDCVIAERVVKILILEDIAANVELIERSLRNGDGEFVSQYVDTREGFVEALDVFRPDIVLCDYDIASFDGPSAIGIVRERDALLPVILLSGARGDEAALEITMAGANDHVLKERLAHLPSVVESALAVYEDTCSRRSAQNKLHVADARYRGLFESARDGLLVADAETAEIIDVNPFFVELLGYPRKDYIGKPLWNLRAFGNIVPNEAAFRALQAQGSLHREDALVEAADGSKREIDLVVNLSPGDNRLLFQCSFRDITARLRAERSERAMGLEYRVAELRFRKLFESTSDGILILDAATGKLSDVNPAVTALLGYPAKNYLGMHPWEIGWLRPITADKSAFVEMHDKVYARIEPVTLVGVDGQKLEFRFESSVYGSHEREVVQWRLHDITAQRQSEQRIRDDEALFRSVVEQDLAGIYILYFDGSIAYANQGFVELCGYEIEAIIGEPFVAFLADSEKAKSALAIQGRIAGTLGKRKIIESALLRKDGSIASVLFSNALATFEGKPVLIGLMLDISERKNAQRQSREDDARFHALVEQQSSGVFMLGSDGAFTYVNAGMCAILGRESGELLGHTPMDFVPEDARPAALKELQRKLSGDSAPVDFETRIARKNGEIRAIHITSTMASLAGKPTEIGSVVDVTDRLESLRTRERLATIVNAVDDSIISTTTAGTIVTWNRGSECIYGYSADEAIGQNMRMLLPPAGIAPIDEMYANMIASGDDAVFHAEFPCIKKDGSIIDIFLSVVALKDENGLVTGTAGVSRDITERKAMVRDLESSEKQFRELVEQAPEAIVLYDGDADKFVLANHTALELFESGSEQLLSAGPKQFYTPEQPDSQDVNVSYADHNRRALAGETVTFERQIRVLSGTVKICEVRLSPLPSNEGHLIRESFIEITERKRAEKKIARATRALKALSAANEAVVHATDEVALLQKLCDLLVDVGGYAFAWIGAPEINENRNVRILAYAGSDAGFLDIARGTWGDSNRDNGPTHRAMRTGEMQVDPRYDDVATRPWRTEARARGFLSAIALPLKVGSVPFTVLTIYAGDADAFDAEELGLLAELVNDLSFGIKGLRNSEERTVAIRRLQENLEATVRAIASTLELRDPYTAGHQRRVGMLAATIARELGYSEDRAHGVYLAGVVHDIGKITVPAEILSKPGKLTSTEFDLIRVHAQAGYGILKDISFPWPLPEMVRQHHERLDGTGYPRGLKGDEILPEAKIIAVADVMEAMLAHRPYRPSRGVAAALAELERGRGTIYDTAAVDVCLSLFREKGFAFDYELDQPAEGL